MVFFFKKCYNHIGDNMDYIKQIEEYIPYNEQEASDKELILNFIKNNPDNLSRENNVAHMTASAWVLNESHDKVIMIYHNIYNSWSWTGGHADNDPDLLHVAMKEVNEETGITHIKPIQDSIFSLEILTVDGHMKKGKYVSSHLHLNVTYLLEAKESDLLKVKEDENSGVKWFSLDDAVKASTEEWFKERIYTKLNNKVREIFK